MNEKQRENIMDNMWEDQEKRIIGEEIQKVKLNTANHQ